jgi:hypothetical protein
MLHGESCLYPKSLSILLDFIRIGEPYEVNFVVIVFYSILDASVFVMWVLLDDVVLSLWSCNDSSCPTRERCQEEVLSAAQRRLLFLSMGPVDHSPPC